MTVVKEYGDGNAACVVDVNTLKEVAAIDLRRRF